LGRRSFAQVRVDPHLAQNPRSTPGDELYLAIAPLVTVTAESSKATKMDAGAPVCRRQLSQWHHRTHFGRAAARKRTAPQRHRPSNVSLMSLLLPALLWAGIVSWRAAPAHGENYPHDSKASIGAFSRSAGSELSRIVRDRPWRAPAPAAGQICQHKEEQR
jgi:hypothetical protein